MEYTDCLVKIVIYIFLYFLLADASGRRLDDSIIMDQGARKRFEGSLIKFQANKGDLAYSTLSNYVDKEDEEQIKVCL